MYWWETMWGESGRHTAAHWQAAENPCGRSCGKGRPPPGACRRFWIVDFTLKTYRGLLTTFLSHGRTFQTFQRVDRGEKQKGNSPFPQLC